MGRPADCRCGCAEPFDFVTLKAFDSDGAFLYEYKIWDRWESHAGDLFATEMRETTYLGIGSVSWNIGAGTNTASVPPRDGIAPDPGYKVWALDSVSIVKTTGAKTLLHSDVDWVYSLYDPDETGDPYIKYGIPFIVYNPNSEPQAQLYQATSAGLILPDPLANDGFQGLPILLIFDPWVQAITCKYRLRASLLRPTSGGTCEYEFFNGASSATIPYNATALQVKTALETITDVVEVTATGGPLPYASIDFTVEWTNDDDQFTDVSLTDSKVPSAPSIAVLPGIYDIVNNLYVGDAGDGDDIFGPWTSDETGTLIGNCARHDLTTGAWGLEFDPTPAWSGTKLAGSTLTCADNTTGAGLARLKYGKALIVGDRRLSGGTGRAWACVDEATGTVEGEGDFLPRNDNSSAFGDDETVLSIGGSVCENALGAMTGGNQFTSQPTTGGALSDAWLLGTLPSAIGGFIGTDATHVMLGGYYPVAAISETGLSRTAYSPHGVTLISGGDAFFPTKDYNQHLVNFYAQSIWYNDDLEWKLTLGDPGSAPTFETSWFAYDETEATVLAELDAWFGLNSAGLPVIQLSFATPPQNAKTEVPWYARGVELVITASATPSDIFTHGLMPNNFRFQIKLKNGTQRIQRQVAKVEYDTPDIVWQRDLGVAPTGFEAFYPPFTGPNGAGVVYDHEILIGLALYKPATHPTLVTGPL